MVNFYFFSVFDTAAAPDPGPSDSSLPLPWTPALFFRELPSCFLLFVCALGARACAARVCVCVCLGGVCVGVNASVCVGVKASLCVCQLGLGVTLACLLHTSCGISSLVFKTLFHPPTSASSPLGLPPLSVLHGPLLPTLSLQRKHGFHRAKKEQGCKLSPSSL